MNSYTSAAFWSITTHLSLTTSMLLRNIIFARFLSSSDFAIALTFGLVLSLFEYISNFGHENFMQRSAHGDSEKFQATLHSMMIARGIIVSAILLVISPFVPSLLNIQNIDFNYSLLAIVPFINAFAHLDHQRLHRRQNYTVSAKIGLIADTSSIVVALVSVSILNNYWAFYISFVFRHTISTVLSHVYAQRQYLLAFDYTHIKSLMVFGFPLLLVGLLKYLGMELDKAIIARIAGLETFTVYVLTLMLLVNGTNIITQALSKIFIRRVSVAHNSIEATVSSNGLIHCFLVLPLVTVLCGLGENIIQLIFGPQYLPIPFLITAVSAVVGLRSINQWLNQTVIASAPTKLMLFADLTRASIALLGVWMVYVNGNAIQISLVFWVSELGYFIVLSYLLNTRFSIATASIRVFFIYTLSAMVTFVLYINTLESDVVNKTVWAVLLATLMTSTFMLCSKTCRTQVKSIFSLN